MYIYNMSFTADSEKLMKSFVDNFDTFSNKKKPVLKNKQTKF